MDHHNTDNERIKKKLREILSTKKIEPEDIPDIGLYMDQVTTFMENKLAATKRYPDDKLMTKTMINNYTKNRLLPPSLKKKYSREHVIVILMIYYLKNMLSITDIKAVLEPLNSFFPSDRNKELSLEEIYRRISDSYDGRKEETISQLMEMLEDSRDTFSTSSLSEKDRRYLNDLSMICNLAFDIYIRKRLIEQLIDDYHNDYPNDFRKKKKPSK